MDRVDSMVKSLDKTASGFDVEARDVHNLSTSRLILRLISISYLVDESDKVSFAIDELKGSSKELADAYVRLKRALEGVEMALVAELDRRIPAS